VHYETDDLRIAAINPLIPPAILMEELPVSEAGSETVADARRMIGACLRGDDQRLVVVVGPCSIHDTKAAVEYAERLREQADRLARDLLIVMRVYFEKPRTNVGWKGLINDPFIDGSFSINKGLRMARALLCQLADLQVPAGCEFLDTIMPQFLADLVSWGAIGARTTESQVHRELASGMSCPMGFKNATHGSIQVAVDAIEAARHAHHFLSVTKQSVAAIVSTHGNADCHVIMRGSNEGPNYDIDSLIGASELLQQHGLNPRLMVDCSHGNSSKIATKQVKVAAALAENISTHASPVFGVMIESNLVGGRQDVVPGRELIHGQSITDACLGWEETVEVLEILAAAARKRV
jgi:3-deoxy-7-phosphoheptulonate synthase